MFGRRSFLIGCGGLAAAPVIAQLPIAATRSPLTDSLDAAALSSAVDPASLALRIDGWDMTDGAGHAAPGAMWIRINSSWRADWH
jgi:hypothetical protein